MEVSESKGMDLPGQCHQRHQEQLDRIRDDDEKIKDPLRNLPALTIMKDMCENGYEKIEQKRRDDGRGARLV